MKKIQINIPEDIVNKIQRNHSEVDSRMLLIDRLMDTHKDTPDFIDSPIFKRYHDEFVEFSTEFDMRKQELTKNYIPEYLLEHQINWSLDYDTCILNVEILCDCEIPEIVR